MPALTAAEAQDQLGDEVSVYAELVKTGRTSMTIEVEAWRRQERQALTRRLRPELLDDRSPSTVATPSMSKGPKRGL